MALKLLHTAGTPLGEYDALDTDLTAGFLGGEIVTWGTVGSVATSGTADTAAADAADGYLNPADTGINSTGSKRVVLTKALGSTANQMMLVDDGLKGYGVLFGVVTGGTAGQSSFAPGAGTPLGPPTYVASGKLTVWATPGLFGVTLDACDTTASTGLQPTNPTTCVPGAKLFVTTGGLLTPNSGATGVGTPWAGRFVDFETNRSLVTTPNRLVQALNSPSSTVAATLPNQLTMAVFSFAPNQ